MNTNKPTVFVIDTDTDFTNHICSMVDTIGVFGRPLDSPQAFLDLQIVDRPSCMLANTRLPGMGGLLLQKRLKDLACPIPVILTTDIIGDVASAVSAMKNGAVDFLEKPIQLQSFLDLVQSCIAMDIKENKRQKAKAAVSQKYDLLTAREKQVISLCVQGQNNKTIADTLGISVKTVEALRTTTIKKCRHNRC